MGRDPVENWAIFPDTHERIIEDDAFEKVQEIRQKRHRRTKLGKSNMFSGLVYCADCGSKMYYDPSNQYDAEHSFFDCVLHRKDQEKCPSHFIRTKVLEQLALKHIQTVTGDMLYHEKHFRRMMEAQMRIESAKKSKANKKQLARDEKRIAELKRLFIKVYEDNANGRLSGERLDMLSQSNEAEQKQLETR